MTFNLVPYFPLALLARAFSDDFYTKVNPVDLLQLESFLWYNQYSSGLFVHDIPDCPLGFIEYYFMFLSFFWTLSTNLWREVASMRLPRVLSSVRESGNNCPLRHIVSKTNYRLQPDQTLTQINVGEFAFIVIRLNRNLPSLYRPIRPAMWQESAEIYLTSILYTKRVLFLFIFFMPVSP